MDAIVDQTLPKCRPEHGRARLCLDIWLLAFVPVVQVLKFDWVLLLFGFPEGALPWPSTSMPIGWLCGLRGRRRAPLHGWPPPRLRWGPVHRGCAPVDWSRLQQKHTIPLGHISRVLCRCVPRQGEGGVRLQRPDGADLGGAEGAQRPLAGLRPGGRGLLLEARCSGASAGREAVLTAVALKVLRVGV